MYSATIAHNDQLRLLNFSCVAFCSRLNPANVRKPPLKSVVIPQVRSQQIRKTWAEPMEHCVAPVGIELFVCVETFALIVIA